MPRSIVLLCPPDDRFHLASMLAVHNPALTVTAVSTAEALEGVLAAVDPDTRLIAFRTGVVVPERLLARLQGPAYNFHPGPPAFPGKHPVAFALYDGAARFGATAHEMAAVVDSGPIVGVAEFEVGLAASYADVNERAIGAMIHLFLRLAQPLAASPGPLPRLPVAWGPRRCSQKALEALCALTPDLDPTELQRRVRAFGPVPGTPLAMTVHGHRFAYAG
ncbi:formyltransferase family protein [Azospirillum sp. TSO22-1]|uniref:formyltransferase family protein n=1 Tax=Azospirillum sp. TSO22-1 TaxID=716789 RepID=UPI000D60CD7C|nr:formyltransferase family protein [Azospirillum sp. TSO22-1]PWC35723.1 hypothetical protein TSO221_29045 [Azospirillum sp. TSO22-1]